MTQSEVIVEFESVNPFKVRCAAYLIFIFGIAYGYFVHEAGYVSCLFAVLLYFLFRTKISKYFRADQNGLKLYSTKDESFFISWDDIEKIEWRQDSEEFELVCFDLAFSLDKSVVHGSVRGRKRNRLEMLPTYSGVALDHKMIALKTLLREYKSETNAH
ncbi:hypothetical protein [Arenicella xantha]|uniref:Uncharacterized protein n=1 Tax=Arenicella xantha TaxID=644221 RepID=A0A395JFH4_9GAMM|nr:hypothetical protein [Arenicella xantha]RBP47026.1 hypothetical protein DFR28_11210 [Arenicella xantha]